MTEEERKLEVMYARGYRQAMSDILNYLNTQEWRFVYKKDLYAHISTLQPPTKEERNLDESKSCENEGGSLYD